MLQTRVWNRHPRPLPCDHGNRRASCRHPRRDPDLPDAGRGGEDQGAPRRGVGRDARPASRDPGRRLLRVPVRPRLRQRRRGRPRARARRRAGRRRSVQRSVPARHDDRLPEHDPGVRASRSTTRTPSRPAAAATRSRSPRTKSCPKERTRAAAARAARTERSRQWLPQMRVDSRGWCRRLRRAVYGGRSWT